SSANPASSSSTCNGTPSALVSRRSRTGAGTWPVDTPRQAAASSRTPSSSNLDSSVSRAARRRRARRGAGGGGRGGGRRGARQREALGVRVAAQVVDDREGVRVGVVQVLQHEKAAVAPAQHGQ